VSALRAQQSGCDAIRRRCAARRGRWSTHGRAADIGAGVVQHQVFEMDEFAVDPQRTQASENAIVQSTRGPGQEPCEIVRLARTEREPTPLFRIFGQYYSAGAKH
jgi:hypothetical protein